MTSPKTASSRRSHRPGPKAMIVAGVMSGTSADGIDVALCRVAPAARPGGLPRVRVLAHRGYPFSAELRGAVLAAMDARETSTAALARLSWRLGEAYAVAVRETVSRTGIEPQLIAMHGQTLFHEPGAVNFLDRPVRSTWQTGEPAVLAERLRLPVVSDFRPADLAAGGQGAPLVPMLDLCAFRHPKRNRILLNLGGIANMTALPAGCDVSGVLAFDSGPANMLVDACMEQLTGKRFDCGGGLAGRGEVLQSVLTDLLAHPYFAAPPPKSCGREQFGEAYAAEFLSRCGESSRRDIIATATALTSSSVLDAYRRFVWPHLGQLAPLASGTDLFVSGGGAHNRTLLRTLQAAFEPLYVCVRKTEDAGMGVEAKEAAAFALLGWLTWHGLPGNVPSATGAARPVILGRISHGG